ATADFPFRRTARVTMFTVPAPPAAPVYARQKGAVVFHDRTLAGHAMTFVALLVTASSARAASPSPTVTLEGHVASVIPSGDVHVRDDPRIANQSPSAVGAQHENDNYEKRGHEPSSCDLTSGSVLACATTPDGTAPPACSALDRRCD